MSSMPAGPSGSATLSPPSTSDAPKQLHPSDHQLAAEAVSGIPGDISAQLAASGLPAAAAAAVSGPVLAAPKPTVIETRTGPVSPKVSPRGLGAGLGLGDRGAVARSPLSRSPAYSPRQNTRSLAVPQQGQGQGQQGDAGAGAGAAGASPLERRSSGGGSSLSNLLSSAVQAGSPLGPSQGAVGNGVAATGPHLVRRMSKPMILSAGVNAALQSFLSRHTVADILQARPVIELPSSATPIEGFELLLNNNVLSCPVWDAPSKSYIGFLDVRDLVSSIVFAHEEQKLTASFTNEWNELMLKGMQRFGSAVSVTYLSRRNPFRPMTVGASLLQVSRALSTQLHRVPIVDDSGRCIGIVSQSVLIKFLAAHRDELKDELRQTVGALQLGMCKVISVPSDASAWQAFKVLELNSVSGIAIVDRDGKLVGNTSARDLKYFMLNRGNLSLDAPIQDYLAKIRQRDIDEARHPSCSVSIGATISHVIGLLSATGYHRVFVVDAAGRPVGVVSITDILRFASAEAAGSAAASATASPSNPSTPRGKQPASAAGSASPASASSATPPPAAAARAPHLRTNSQTSGPIVTPLPNQQ